EGPARIAGIAFSGVSASRPRARFRLIRGVAHLDGIREPGLQISPIRIDKLPLLRLPGRYIGDLLVPVVGWFGQTTMARHIVQYLFFFDPDRIVQFMQENKPDREEITYASQEQRQYTGHNAYPGVFGKKSHLFVN